MKNKNGKQSVTWIVCLPQYVTFSDKTKKKYFFYVSSEPKGNELLYLARGLREQ